MILPFVCIVTTLWLVRSYCGWLVSWILSLVIRCPISVGDVRWLRLVDVRLRLKNGLTVHIDDWSVQFFPQNVSKPLLLRFGDVRVEADAQHFSPKEGQSEGSGMSRSGRFNHLVQYCGVAVNSIQLVLLDVIPGCMLHMSGDELLAETFRSREGWQLELSSRLMHGKLYRRKETSEPQLANCALSIQISIDVSGGVVTRLGLKLADPSVHFNRGLLDAIREFRDLHAPSVFASPKKTASSTLYSRLQKLTDATVAINNCTVVYTAATLEQSCRKSLSLRVGQVDVQKKNVLTQGKVAGLVLTDHLHNALVTTGQLSTKITESSSTAAELVLRSDSLVTNIQLHDALWWKEHVQEIAVALRPSHSPIRLSAATTKPPKITLSLAVELDSVQGNFSDGDSFHSTVSLELLTVSKKAGEWECGAESLLMADTSTMTSTAAANYNYHHWGQTLYVGVALVRFVQDPYAPALNVCMNDVKMEWTDKLASQVNRLMCSFHPLRTLQVSSNPTSRKKLTVKIKSKRAALVLTARDASYILATTEELRLEQAGGAELVSSMTSTRIGLGNVTPKGVRLSDLAKAKRLVPVVEQEGTRPFRCWSQKSKDEEKAKRRKHFEEYRSRGMLLIGEANLLCLSFEAASLVTRDITVSSNAPVYFCWSPLIHRVIYHLKCGIKEALTIKGPSESVRKTPKILQFKLLTNHSVELDVHLPRDHRMAWKIPSLTFDKSANSLTAISPSLVITMNGHDIVSAMNICITKRPSDARMEICRQAFGNLRNPTNKIWTWAADSFLFHLPFEFNFYEVFDEFINAFRWIKTVHGLKKKSFTADSPLPADLRIVFKEARLEMDDDPFENLLQTSHDLKEDEVYECERRHQMLVERLNALKRTNPLFPQTKIDELLANLLEKNSAIYIERWKKLEFSSRPIFVSSWQGFEIRAFADPSLHGTDICTEMIHQFDPQSYFPTAGLQFSTLWGRAVEFDMAEWTIQFRDYSTHYLDAKDVHFFGHLVGAQHIEESGRSLRESDVELPEPWETHTIQRNMSSLKFYYDMQCETDEWNVTYGRCWEPCLSMISALWNNINAKSRDPSPPLPYWDKMRFLLHGRFSWLCNKMVTTVLASPDPYNTTETLELCWDNLGLDWALGEIRIRCGLRVFIRTASRYDDSRIISLPELKLRINLDWICGGDPHDHHAVVLCAPHKLPHYSTNHDSYRAFRSRCLDLLLSFDVGPGSGTGDGTPQCLLYANNFRCLEVLIKTFTLKNRLIKKGPVFGTPFYAKPQISKHFRTVQVSVNLPKFFISYWMSHFSDYGFRITSEGLNLLVTMKLSAVPTIDTGITRRAVHVWSPEHVSATLWDTQVHVFGPGDKPETQEEAQTEKSLLLGLSRVSYVRENNMGNEAALHRLTAHDLKASWTAEIRDSCLTIADGVHRAHLLRRILSNDAIKKLNIHQEEEPKPAAANEPALNRQESYWDEKGHKRGYSLSDTNQSMLNLLIEESNTRLVAHCEQATDLPTENLLGVIQCTMDDIMAINWQVDLLNSQVVLKGSGRGGFVLLTAAHASLTQKLHKNAWRSGQLFAKKSWSCVVSGMQYFAPVGTPSSRAESKFKWLQREFIEEKPNDSNGDPLSHVVGDGEAVGGVVQTGLVSDPQLQRIVRRCSCEIYFCYFSEIMKTDTLEETVVQKVEPEAVFGREDVTGVDCLTLKHNMLEASTCSEQYEFLVDIVNTLVLFVDPKKKEQADHRRRIQLSCEQTQMEQMRKSIEQQQAQLRQIVAVVRSLERQLYHIEMSGVEDDGKRREITEEMEEYKAKQLEVADQLAIYISCYKQRQVEATLAVVRKPEEDQLAPIARRFEVCFEDCIWRLTESDGQISLSEIQIRNFLYTRTMRIDSSGEHLFEVGSVRISNLLPETIYRDTLHRDERVATRQPALRLLLRDLAPVGGICVKEHFEVNISPMVVQMTYDFFAKMWGFFFPGNNIDKEDQLENVEEGAPKFSFTRRITGTLSMRSSKGVQMERKQSAANGKLKPEEVDDIERMRQRAHDNNFFLYIKIPEVPFVVSYKGKDEKNIEDVERFGFLFPLCEYHEKNWTWLDLSLAVKQRCRKILIQQYMKHKLLRSRILGTVEPVEGMTEEEKKLITVGATNAVPERKKKK